MTYTEISEIHKFLIAMLFGILASEAKNYRNPEEFIDICEDRISITEGNEHLKPYLKEFFDLARESAQLIQEDL